MAEVNFVKYDVSNVFRGENENIYISYLIFLFLILIYSCKRMLQCMSSKHLLMIMIDTEKLVSSP